MKYLKRIFSVVAMVLCLTLCVDAVSHAAAIKYKETKFGSQIKGYSFAERLRLKVNGSGKIQLALHSYTSQTCVTYSSNGKKQFNSSPLMEIPCDTYEFMEFYGNKNKYIYSIKNKKLLIYKDKSTKKYEDIKKIKTIKLDVSKYLKKKSDSVELEIAEITGKNKVRIHYRHVTSYRKHMTMSEYMNKTTKVAYGYGGIIEVNTATKKIKKLVAADFIPKCYDEKNIYGYETEADKITFYQKSIKTNKEKKFVADKITFDEDKYEFSGANYSIYNGKIMGISPTGAVYYGTFENKKFEQIGNIAGCANFKKYEVLDFVMKSKNEFYILYGTGLKKNEEYDHAFGKLFLFKYKKL